ncbi:MAG: hypothetical protein ACE37F_22400 [Nannocystaceae bacterium]|nr:hypothetical protein [bacterium]
MLCASLGLLAEDAALALGATRTVEAAGDAAALLSLLTKVDDEVIDAADFHGGPMRRGGHRALRRRVRSYLAPTLDSVLTGRPATDEARCVLAAEVGRQLQRLAGSRDRLDRLHGVLAAGWETQVRAVDILSRHPGESTPADVARVTASISGDWLLMITMVGGLPPDASREISDAEIAAFDRWGWHIQRADALADFIKDVGEGLANSWAGMTCERRFGSAYHEAVVRRDVAALERMLGECAHACVATAAEVETSAHEVVGLGDVAGDLAWIHGMLLGRWRARRGGAA